MKIIWTDGLNRDHVNDNLIAEGITNEEYGDIMLKALRASRPYHSEWFLIVPDDHKLKKFEP